MMATDFDVEMEYDGKRYIMTGSITDYSPAVPYLANGDPGSPADGGLLEDVELWKNHDGKKARKLSEKETDALVENDHFYWAAQLRVMECLGGDT